MLHSGLVSVTFRKLGVTEIIGLVAEAGLDGIEWGGDIHVPHGNTVRAREVSRMTADAGLKVSSYGSYYVAGSEEPGNPCFESVLETAAALGAPAIRIWAGDKGSAESDTGWFERVAADSRRVAGLSRQAGISVCFEYHPNTLTDTPDSAARLMDEAASDNLLSYWQPSVGSGFDENLAGLIRISSKLGNIHVFNWQGYERLPLSTGMEQWKGYLSAAGKIPGDRFCLLEFVKGDSRSQFIEDAASLKALIIAAST